MKLQTIIMDHPLVTLTMLVYAAAFLVAVPALIKRSSRGSFAGTMLLLGGFVLNTIVIIARWIEAGRPPFKTLYETLLLYPWCVALLVLFLVWANGLRLLVPLAAAINAVLLGYALGRPDVEIVHLPPALQSVWFIPHVVVYFIAYGALALTAVLAAILLLQPAWRRWRTGETIPPADAAGPPADVAGQSPGALERTTHSAAAFGILTLTLGLLMGAVWGKYAWGDYWSWDPKENWALITWLGYMGYAHVRLIPKWRNEALWILIISFGALVFTYLGMHLLPTAGSSMHVYQ